MRSAEQPKEPEKNYANWDEDDFVPRPIITRIAEFILVWGLLFLIICSLINTALAGPTRWNCSPSGAGMKSHCTEQVKGH
jgi:hypothetical protein